MGWLKERAKAFGHGIEKAGKSVEHYAKEYIGGYIGYNSNGGVVINPMPTSQNAFSPTTFNENITEPSIWHQVPGAPNSYSRTTARTAKDIAQGGMTKDEIIAFNQKHPNETMMRGQ